MFWLACEELKRETNPEAIEEKARFIYEDYISILSPKEVRSSYMKYLPIAQLTSTYFIFIQVSLDSRVREIVNRNMVEPTPHTFDEAQLQIYTLMHRDSYPRYDCVCVTSGIYGLSAIVCYFQGLSTRHCSKRLLSFLKMCPRPLQNLRVPPNRE